ncbi:RNase P modulator RnpM [Candidatus Xianfuyuplasma coldseepsis]|uniref:YlxR family protein n=1 Tax=Candidatus Xianfuyuplasma coldseepsis TaxID=2782163 RepID=A0A7L7KQ85_9MOLU|nr:YlxR family protein [Xianfuyuplasma coldseepsis]QMS84366.1 YlxR family protein [Xianfuyuplasma coldseepsis]
MKQRKIPLRKCVITNERVPKKELIRVVRTPEGQVEVDLTGKKNGRGAYVSKTKQVILKAKKTKKLDRHLEVSVPEEIYDELLQIIEQQ